LKTWIIYSFIFKLAGYQASPIRYQAVYKKGRIFLPETDVQCIPNNYWCDIILSLIPDLSKLLILLVRIFLYLHSLSASFCYVTSRINYRRQLFLFCFRTIGEAVGDSDQDSDHHRYRLDAESESADDESSGKHTISLHAVRGIPILGKYCWRYRYPYSCGVLVALINFNHICILILKLGVRLKASNHCSGSCIHPFYYGTFVSGNRNHLYPGSPISDPIAEKYQRMSDVCQIAYSVFISKFTTTSITQNCSWKKFSPCVRNAQCGGSGMFYPGSGYERFFLLDPRSEHFHPGSFIKRGMKN
jgi:hypothetical protein